MKFRRQHPFGPYILDFFSVKHRLVVEVDGSVHDLPDQQLADQERSEQLRALGLRVLRFRNAQVMQDLNGVLEEIQQAASE